jgi:PhnB protein
MSEQFLNEQVEQLDETIDAIVAGGETVVFSTDQPELAELASLGSELRLLPRESFKSSLKETLRRSANMTTTGSQQSPKNVPAGYHTITPYLTVKRAEQLVDFVKEVFDAREVLRTTGSAGGLHAEVTIGDSKLMIGGYESVEEKPMALHLYVPDADAVYQRAMAAGATSLEEPVDQVYGDREAGVKDLSGNFWWIATHKLGPAGTYIPEGMRPVTPGMAVVGADKLIEFLQQAFGAEVISRHESPEGAIHHATVRIGDSMIELGEAHGIAQPMPPALFVYVENLEAAYERALGAGAVSLQPPADQGYGRTAWVQDTWGNIWYLAVPLETKKG